MQWLRRRSRRQLHALAALGIVAVGIMVLVLFAMLRRPPERVEEPVRAPLVDVLRLARRDIAIVVQGYGTVAPSVQVDIVPEVAGKVVFVHSELNAGGIIPAGEMIAQIDPTDYELAVRQAQAAVAEAQVRLDLERAEAEVARREWRQLQPQTEPESPLVLREPQVRRAETALESAKAQLTMAELRLQRTVLSLPFDVLIIRERVGLGQFVSVGQSFATAFGLDTFEIEVPLRDEELAWFDVLDGWQRQAEPSELAAGTRGAADRRRTPAEVRAHFAGRQQVWSGYVTRTTGQVDPATRMVPVIIEVSEPMESREGRPPLMPGAFVEVRIAGRMLSNAVAVPRHAIDGENRVWVVQDGRLRSRQLEIARTDRDFAYVTSGLPDEVQVVVSPPEPAVEGMQVRVRNAE